MNALPKPSLPSPGQAAKPAVPVSGKGANTPANGKASSPEPLTLVDELLAEQAELTAVEKFSQLHDAGDAMLRQKLYRDLIPLRAPGVGEQYAFSVDLDRCSGCKACVSACHGLNGLEDEESWRTVGMLVSREETPFDESVRSLAAARIQHVTTACHHCVDPGCLNGCPVLAYEKDATTGIVRHLDDQCIGCTYCVMKCPYEVPKYSSRLGIVRKCDMCANRLAVGEAPACAQACPTEAIKITLVQPEKIRASYLATGTNFIRNNPFLPDSPAPNITLPSTQFFSTRSDVSQFAADHNAPRLDHAHWPLVIMLTLTQTSVGLFLVATAALLAGFEKSVLPLTLLGLAFLAVGLGASVAHLGKPMKAWRAFLGWKTSWLSREIIAFNGFAAFAFGTGTLLLAKHFFPNHELMRAIPSFAPVAGMIAASLAGLVAVFTSAMVYVDTHRPFWAIRFAFGNFYGTALLLGSCFAALVTAWLHLDPRLNQIAALTTAGVLAALLVWRQFEISRAFRDVANPVHLNAKVIRELLPWTGGLGAALSVSSMVFSTLALSEQLGMCALFCSVAALAAFSSEIMWRYVFFAAGASKKMPGGIAS